MQEIQIITGFCFFFSVLTILMVLSLTGGRKEARLQVVDSRREDDQGRELS